ncbi:hypothetical protein GVN21_20330, partial [Caulobacter sp. SLTY]|nr:hypothetical protein [Caulobacter sp. SLTY]
MKKTHLAAAAVAALGLSAMAASAQAPSWYGGFDELPEGSYQRTCRDITAFNGMLYANCRDRSNRLVRSELNMRNCRGRVENFGGQLRCEYGGGGG